ncbi:hypothetical protein Tco_0609401, partial [Tanacetum coccineum]
HLGKFDGKTDEGFFVGYSTNSKAFRVFNSKTRIVKENLHVQFSENSSNIAGSGPNWLFDIDALTKSMNYKPVVAGNQSNGSVGTKACDDACKARIQTIKGGGKEGCYPRNKDSEVPSTEEPRINQEKEANINNTNNINTVSPTVNVAGIEDNVVDENIVYGCADDLKMPNLEEIVYSVDDEDNDAEADMNNLNSIILVSPIPTTRLHKDHPLEQIIRDIHSAPQTIRMTKSVTEHGELTFFLGLQVTQKEDGIFISQDKYVDEILKKFGFSTVKTASTPMETSKPLMKDESDEDVNVHLYRSMIRSLMYVTSSRPDIIYLKGQPKLGLWYPKDSPFDLEAYTDSDYAGASLDMKSTTGGCQFHGSRLISWQCKKQTVVANSITKAEYVAASNCCGQVLWIQNQLLDYGYNFMNTKIFIDNESTICIVKNPVFHSKTKHIESRHHFIRDSNEKKLIQMIKIHIDHNVADLLTKAIDVSRFQYLIASIGMLNL